MHHTGRTSNLLVISFLIFGGLAMGSSDSVNTPASSSMAAAASSMGSTASSVQSSAPPSSSMAAAASSMGSTASSVTSSAPGSSSMAAAASSMGSTVSSVQSGAPASSAMAAAASSMGSTASSVQSSAPASSSMAAAASSMGSAASSVKSNAPASSSIAAAVSSIGSAASSVQSSAPAVVSSTGSTTSSSKSSSEGMAPVSSSNVSSSSAEPFVTTPSPGGVVLPAGTVFTLTYDSVLSPTRKQELVSDVATKVLGLADASQLGLINGEVSSNTLEFYFVGSESGALATQFDAAANKQEILGYAAIDYTTPAPTAAPDADPVLSEGVIIAIVCAIGGVLLIGVVAYFIVSNAKSKKKQEHVQFEVYSDATELNLRNEKNTPALRLDEEADDIADEASPLSGSPNRGHDASTVATSPTAHEAPTLPLREPQLDTPNWDDI